MIAPRPHRMQRREVALAFHAQVCSIICRIIQGELHNEAGHNRCAASALHHVRLALLARHFASIFNDQVLVCQVIRNIDTW